MICDLMSKLSVSSIGNYFYAYIFDDVVEGMLGFELKRLEMVNSKPTLCSYERFAPWAL